MKGLLVLLLALVPGGPALGSHDWLGLDLCRSRPERMPPELSAADLPEPGSAGARLLARHCAQCHNLPHPGLHTAGEWDAVAGKMYLLSEVTARLGGRADLLIPDQAQREAIGLYLERHALRPLPEGAPAPSVYLQVCGDCHVPPDPKRYATEAWPAVLERMAAHRVVMARGPLEPRRAAQVLAYLTGQGTSAEPGTAPGRWVALAPVLAIVGFGAWLMLGRLLGRRPA